MMIVLRVLLLSFFLGCFFAAATVVAAAQDGYIHSYIEQLLRDWNKIVPKLFKANQRSRFFDPLGQIKRLEELLENSTQEDVGSERLSHLDPVIDEMDPKYLSALLELAFENSDAFGLDLSSPAQDRHDVHDGEQADRSLSEQHDGERKPPIGTEIYRLILYTLSSITPIIGAVLTGNDQCILQSIAYLKQLGTVPNLGDFDADDVDNDGDAGFGTIGLWALQMLDSSGKLPDGILRDVYEFDLCEFLPADLMEQLGRFCPLTINVPNGNTVSYGSYEGCLQVKSQINITTALENTTDFIGRYCYQKINPNPDVTTPFINSTKQEYGRLLEKLDNTSRNERIPHYLDSLRPGPQANFGLIPGWIDWAGLQVGNGNGTVIQDLAKIYAFVMRSQWGQCVPEACGEAEMYVNYGVMFRELGLHTDGGLNGIPGTMCQTEKTKRLQADVWPAIDQPIPINPGQQSSQSNSLAWGCASALIIIACLMAIGTFIDCWQQIMPYGPTLRVSSKDAEDSFIVKVLKCFSVNINGTKVLNTDVDSTGKDYLGCVSGIRALSICWVIVGHTYLQAFQLPLINPHDTTKGRTSSVY